MPDEPSHPQFDERAERIFALGVVWLLGDELEQAGDLAEAERTLAEATASPNPHMAAAAIHRLGVLFFDRDPVKAEYYLRQAMEAQHPDHWRQAGYELAGVLVGQGRVQEAMTELVPLAEGDDDVAPLAAHVLGQLELTQGEIDSAIRHLERAVSCADETTAAHAAFLLGFALVRAERSSEALVHLERAARSGAEFADRAAGLAGALLVESGRVQDGLELLRQVAHSHEEEVARAATRVLGRILSASLRTLGQFGERYEQLLADKGVSPELRETLEESFFGAALARQLPDSGEFLPTYLMLADLAQDVEAAFERAGVHLTDRPRLHTEWGHDVNGHAVVEPDEHGAATYHVFVDHGVFTYLHLIGRALMQSLKAARESIGPEGGTLASEDIRDVDDRFYQALRAYLVAGDFRDAPAYEPGETEEAAGRLTRFMELFLVAHEYGHVIAGHHVRRSLGEGDDAVGWDHEAELEADAMALNALAHVEDADLLFVVTGATCLIRALWALELGEARLRGEDEVGEHLTHPSWPRRIEAVRARAAELLGGEDATDERESTRVINDVIGLIFTTLLARSGPRLAAQTLAPRWRAPR
ncbi:MAG: hypothetical protein WBP81_11075 [Solirubrobacteraceae bacterium]